MPGTRKKFEVGPGVPGVPFPHDLLDQLVQGPMTPDEVQILAAWASRSL